MQKSLNVISDERPHEEVQCVYGECDGSGAIYKTGENGYTFVTLCRCRDYAITQKRLKFANIPAEFENLTVNSFNTEIYQSETARNDAKDVKRIAIEYVLKYEDVKELGKGLYLYGEEKGSGKTRLAVSIGNALMSKYKEDVKFVTTLNLLDEIKKAWSAEHNEETKTETETALLTWVNKASVLILDDIGTERPTRWVNETLFNILNERMTHKRITIFTSNCRVEDLAHDGRVISRIRKMAVPVKFPDESIRDAMAKEENERLMRMFLEG